jgi:hypothetical protein
MFLYFMQVLDTPKETEEEQSFYSSSSLDPNSSSDSSSSVMGQPPTPGRPSRTQGIRNAGRGHGGRGSRGRAHGPERMVSQTPASLEKSPWKDNQDDVAYDDQATETFEGGKGADDDNEW